MPSTATDKSTNTYLHVLLFLGLAVSFLIAWGMPHVNEDLFVALRNGSAAWHGKLTAPDDTSFTREGKVFVNKAWLSNIVLYLSYRSAHELGPVLLKGLLLAGCLVLLFFRCAALGISRGISLVALTAGTLALAPFLGLRAENFGMFCMILLGSLVNGPASWGRRRQIGAIAAILLWANCHATFVLGFAFLALRVVLDLLYKLNILARHDLSDVSQQVSQDGMGGEGHAESQGQVRQSQAASASDFSGWLITLIIAVVVTAFVNPYGPSYIEIPFSRFTQWQNVIQWGDYLPLLHLPSIFQDRLFKPFCVLPFLALLMLLLMLFLFLAATLGLRGALASLRSGEERIDPFMEAAMALMLLPLVFKWQRLIIFTAPAMIPLLAILMRASFSVLRERIGGNVSPADARKELQARTLGACLWLAVLVGVLYTSVVRLYLPGNPTSPTLAERHLIGRLMSSHLVADPAVEFMRKNDIKGRVFATFQLADYLLFRLKGIKVFFDLRAHAAYDFTIFDQYFSVIQSQPGEIGLTLEILKQWKVDILVLDTLVERRAYNLAVELMKSRQWGCIYKDEWIFILAPADSQRFGSMIREANLNRLWYGDPDTRIVAEALLSVFQKGTLPSDLVDGLKSAVRHRPDPELYTLIVDALNGQNRCLNKPAKTFLESEMNRLAATDYMVAGGVTYTLASLSRIAHILAANEAFCGMGQVAGAYETLRTSTDNKIKILLGRYSMF